MNFIDLERRFHVLTGTELEDLEALVSRSEHRSGLDIGWPDLLDDSRVVLLAEAGSGKTVEMRKQVERLVGEGKYAFFLALDFLDRDPVSDCLSPDETRRFEAWKKDREAPAWFFLDAVDELKLTQGKLDRALRRLSKDLDGHLHHTRIIISCRPSDWRPGLDLDTMHSRLPVPEIGGAAPSVPPDEVFIGALLGSEHTERNLAPQGEDDFPVREAVQTVIMLPMNRAQIERFAQQSGVNDLPAFLEEITRQNAWTFADRPLDLADLIRIWTSSGGLGTRAEQHETNIESKLRDDPERQDRGVLSDTQARCGAERLALALFLTRTRTIRSPEQAPDIHRADGVLDPASILSGWTEAERQALLRRALFDPATYGRVRFHHRSIQEYLAARRLQALRDRSMSTKALFRLLFAERYGVEVVFPSMRAIAAWLSLWDDGVREELIRREPEALLSLGDPETLTMPARGKLVRAFFTAYGEGGWRGLNIPIAEVRRLSHPDLSRVIRKCWGNGPTNDDVRKLLIEMIWQGAVGDCADLAHAVALDASESPYHRIAAIRALVACCRHDSAREIAGAILAQPASWPDRVVHGVAAHLFPGIITGNELITLMERTREPKQTVDGFGWTSRQIAKTVRPLSEQAVSLRNKMADLVWRGRDQEKARHNVHGKFDYIAPALAILCDRQLSESSEVPDPNLIRACVTASRFGGHRSIGCDPMLKLRARIGTDISLRREAFWGELEFMDRLIPTDDDRRRFHNAVIGGLVGNANEADRPWLLIALTDEIRTERCAVALHALIDIWFQRGRSVSELEDIRAALRGNKALGEILEERVMPPEPNEEIEQREHELQIGDRDQNICETQHLRDWKEWHETLLADPADAFSEEKQTDTLYTLYSWLRQKQGSDRLNVWDKDALVQAFGPDIADRAEKAFQTHWRTTQPVLWSARPDEAKNNISGDWILGLLGVSAEASAPGWVSSLLPEEVRAAAVYATIEPNGFAPFIADLAVSHPAEVKELVGGEINAELKIGDEHDHLPTLHNLTYSDRYIASSFKQLLIPRLLAELKSWPSVFTDVTGARWANHLDKVLRILDDASSKADRESIASECATRYEADPVGALALSWLTGLFRFDAARGMHTLITGLSGSCDPDTRERAIETFATLFGGPDSVGFEVPNPVQFACLLGQLVRCAYTFIRPEDDQVHEGVFSPDTRDNAQRARSFLLSRLLDTPGPEARRVVLALADGQDFADLQDYLRHRARQRTAADAEFDPFTPEAVNILEIRYEIPPNDRDSLFVVMMDRLEDLAHDLDHDDFSDRRTVQSITCEPEMQRTLARRLRERANGAYTVTREEEVADGKRTDIRLSAIEVDQKVVVEVKISDNNWSLNDLIHALRNQLVGQYLRHSNCKAGCLLLTYHGRKNYWIHPDTNAQLIFPKAVQFLKDMAQTLEREDSCDVRIAVFSLDLTDPPLTPARREN